MLRGTGSGEVAAVGFTAGFVGAAVVVLTARLLFAAGVGPALGVTSPLPLTPPDVYRPLVWGGLWGIPLAFLLRRLTSRHRLVGFLYFLAPVAALFLVFMPRAGAGFFGLDGGPGVMVNALLANAPFGIVTTLAIEALGRRPLEQRQAVPERALRS
ncbi:hypothetical protein K2Z84_09495 [Candidatus Binatia bacterium]|jgi:hypothetical protein|nr:hypothetical protein [Candidatus Binatia bacterium]